MLLTDGRQEVIIGTEEGMFIRFPEMDVRPMGRAARGVKAITLTPGVRIVGSGLIGAGTHLLMVSALGYGKRVSVEEFRGQRRGGKGLIGMKISEESGPLTGFIVTGKEDKEYMLITARGIVIRQFIEEVSQQKRYSRGVTLMRLDEGDRVVNLIGLD